MGNEDGVREMMGGRGGRDGRGVRGEGVCWVGLPGRGFKDARVGTPVRGAGVGVGGGGCARCPLGVGGARGQGGRRYSCCYG